MKKSYKSIYSFEVIDKIREGFSVFLVDKEKECVESVADMEVCELAKVLNLCEKEKTRFDFWIVNMEEEHE